MRGQRKALTFASLILLCGATRTAAAGDTEDARTRVVTRHDEDAFSSPRALSVLTPATLDDRGGLTLAEQLEALSAVFVTEPNPGAPAPSLRGLMGGQLALTIDGVRISDTLTRGRDGLQLLGTISLSSIERVEVLRGPASVTHGTGAMGGVIDIRARAPRFDSRRAWDAAGEARATYRSDAQAALTHVAAEGHLRSVGLRLGGDFRRFGQLLGGGGQGRQSFTEHWDSAGNIAAAWRPSQHSELRLSYDLMRQHDVGRSDRSRPADFSRFAELSRDLLALRYTADYEGRAVDAVTFTLSFQEQRQTRHRFRLALDRVDREFDDNQTLGLALLLRSELPHNRLSYGVELYADRVGASAEHELIALKQVEQARRGRFIEGSRSIRWGLFLLDRLGLGKKLALDLGGRVAGWSVDIPAFAPEQIPAIGRTRWMAVGSAHVRYLVGDGLNLIAGLSQGFRAPSIADMSARGCGETFFDESNTALDPERNLTAELGVKLDLFGILKSSAFYYFTKLDDAIVYTINEQQKRRCGDNSDGTPREIAMRRPENARDGTIHGVEGDLSVELGRWSLATSITFARGAATLPGGFNESLDRIPPVFGRAWLRYRPADEMWTVALILRWAAGQSRLSSADSGDRTICPDGPRGCAGTPGYALIDLRGAARLRPQLRVTLDVRNLTNERYRVHGSGFDGPGLSAIVGLELRVQ